MRSISIEYLKTAYGELILGSFEEQLCLCDWRYRKMRATIDRRIQNGLAARYIESNSPAIEHAKSQLSEYFAGIRKRFDLPLLMRGTDFQKAVWQALIEVPHAETSTYAALAQQIGRPKAVRAVATANGANALSIFIPCHRIIGSNGQLVGYAGGLRAKRKLLELERIPSLPLA